MSCRHKWACNKINYWFQVLLPFFNQVFLLSLICKSPIQIPNNNPLSDIWFVIIFFHWPPNFQAVWNQGPYLSFSSLYQYPTAGTCVFVLSEIQLFATPWTVAHQASLSMEFSRQDYWTELPFPTTKVAGIHYVIYLYAFNYMVSYFNSCKKEDWKQTSQY